jgi:chromosome segregation ATPase
LIWSLENQLGTERIRRNVAGALQITEAHFRSQEVALQQEIAEKEELIRHLQDRLGKLTARNATQEEEMRSIQSRFEESMTKLAHRKSNKTDGALLRRIAELEEQLMSRDEAVVPKKRKPASSSRSLTKKFKVVKKDTNKNNFY